MNCVTNSTTLSCCNKYVCNKHTTLVVWRYIISAHFELIMHAYVLKLKIYFALDLLNSLTRLVNNLIQTGTTL